MGETQRYAIPYKGLKPGCHEFRFEVDGSLFEEYQSTEIKDGRCEVTVGADRSESRIVLDVAITGYVIVECDRCLEDCRIPIDFEGQLVVKFSEEVHEYDGEVMWMLPGEDQVDLKQYIYESICLSLPYQRVHPDDSEGRSTCDPDMLSRFRIVSEEEFDRLCPGTETDGSSPWEKLKEIKPSK